MENQPLTKDKINFTITTPTGVVYESNVYKVSVPTPQGQMSVFYDHVPLISEISSGEISIEKNGEEILFSVSGGFIHVEPNGRVIVLADSSERAEHIDIERAEEARRRVEEMLKNRDNLNEVQFAKLQSSLEKELVRIKIARKTKRNI